MTLTLDYWAIPSGSTLPVLFVWKLWPWPWISDLFHLVLHCLHCLYGKYWPWPQITGLLYTALNLPSLIFALWRLKVICPVLNSPTLQFSYIILYIQFNSPSFKIALRSEGQKDENKTGAKFSLYTVFHLVLHCLLCLYGQNWPSVIVWSHLYFQIGMALAVLVHHICATLHAMFSANLLMHMCFACFATQVSYFSDIFCHVKFFRG